jgi:hypothetical protein
VGILHEAGQRLGSGLDAVSREPKLLHELQEISQAECGQFCRTQRDELIYSQRRDPLEKRRVDGRA